MHGAALLLRCTEAAALEVIDAEENARDWRRTMRARRGASGWHRGVPQCYGCKRILSGYKVTCPNCGGHAQGTVMQ